MAAPEHGPWEPLGLTAAVDLFSTAEFRWWVAGGHALALHVGRSWRAHDDIDISICRQDAAQLYELLEGWEIHVAAAGALSLWQGSPLDLDKTQNNLWCRRSHRSPWALDITISDGDDERWIYRREPTVHARWSAAILHAQGIPYLAPELQLLYKSHGVRPKDTVDATEIVPELTSTQRNQLAAALSAEHPWQQLIGRTVATRALHAATEKDVELLAAGRSSQAWIAKQDGVETVVRVPIANSGRLMSYRSETEIARRLVARNQPVATWSLAVVEDSLCTVGDLLSGRPIEYGAQWPESFAIKLAELLRTLHTLPAAGWGPLRNQDGPIRGTSRSATQGIVDRWFQAPIWPFDDLDLDVHPAAGTTPDLVALALPLRQAILDAASEPFGVLHSDLHREHLLVDKDGDLTGVLDFGDAFIGATAWDFALLQWYYGTSNAQKVAAHYNAEPTLVSRAQLLSIAVGLYKIARTPLDVKLHDRLRRLFQNLTTPDLDRR